MSRSTAEWKPKSDDAAIPDRVKLRVWNRADGKCQICTRKMLAGDVKLYDHITPLADGGRHAEANLQIACVACHSAKTSEESTARAKVRSKAKAVLGIKRPAGKIKSAPFPPPRRQRSRSRSRRFRIAPSIARSARYDRPYFFTR